MAESQDVDNSSRRRRASAPEAEQAQEKTLSGQEFLAQKIGSSESHMGTLSQVSPDLKYQSGSIFAKIEKMFEVSPNLNNQDAQAQVDFMFSNSIGDDWKAVAADYIHDRMEAGVALDGKEHRDAIAALINGDVEAAKNILNGQVVEEPAPVVAAAEPSPAPVEELEPAGDGEGGVSEWDQIYAERTEQYLNNAIDSINNAKPPAATVEAVGGDQARAVACEQLGRYGTVSYALEAVKANYAGVVSGDLVSLKDIKIDTSKLPEHVAHLAGELEQIQEIVDNKPNVEAACFNPN